MPAEDKKLAELDVLDSADYLYAIKDGVSGKIAPGDVGGGGGEASLEVATATAHAGGGQGSATQLTATVGIRKIYHITAANSGDSVKLPAAETGLNIVVIEDHKRVIIYASDGQPADRILGGSANDSGFSPFDQSPWSGTSSSVEFVCTEANVWVAFVSYTGFSF